MCSKGNAFGFIPHFTHMTVYLKERYTLKLNGSCKPVHWVSQNRQINDLLAPSQRFFRIKD